MTTDPFTMYDAAYVLGALSEDDHRAYEAHLAECGMCAAAVRQLSDLPRVLATIPPPTPRPRIQWNLDRRRRRRRRLIGGLAVTVAACIAAVLVLAVADHSGGHPAPMIAAATQVPIRATAEVTPMDWGTRINLVCRYNNEYTTSGRTYALFVIARDETPQRLGTWNLVPGKVIKYQSGTSLQRGHIASVQIRSANGRHTLLTLTL